MGFFSKLKKIWKTEDALVETDDEVLEKASPAEPEPEAAAEAAEAAAPEAAQPEAAQPEAAQPEAAQAAEAAPVEAPETIPDDVRAAESQATPPVSESAPEPVVPEAPQPEAVAPAEDKPAPAADVLPADDETRPAPAEEPPHPIATADTTELIELVELIETGALAESGLLPGGEAAPEKAEEPEPQAVPEPEPQPAPEPEPLVEPEPEPEPERTPQPEPAPTPQAAPKPAFEPMPAPEPEPQAEAAPPAPAPEPVAVAPAAEPEPEPQPEPMPEVVAAPQPVATPPAATMAPAEARPEPTPAPAVQAPDAPAAEQAPWRNALVLELRQAEPKLSVWLDILLAGVDTPGPELWERLRFLFESLEAPKDEADAFVAKFADWLELMEYDEVELFRSELQYRLALALDLEDEEDERNRLFLKLSEGLSKTKEQIVRRIDGLLGNHAVIDEAFWEELEEILIMADVGFEPAAKLMEGLRERVRKRGTTDPAVFKEILREELAEIFQTTKTIKAINPPEVVMMIGVNGVGKTTTIAKLAHRDIMQGKKVLIAAGDTFRAAAIEQLQIWANRVGADFYSKGEGADPAAVAFEAMDKVLAGGYDVLYLDTAGRLHTKINLMEELKKIRRVVGKKHPGAPHRSVLVLDATTGQNALSQTKLFNEAAGVDEIILTKLDGTAKGGVVVGIALSFGVPITYVGLGEKMEDLRPFVGQDFAQALLGVA